MNILRKLFLLLLLLMASGCSSSKSNLKRTGEQISTLSASADMTLSAGRQEISGRGIISIRYPDLCRVTMLTPFGSVAAEVISTGKRFTFADHHKQEIYTGDIGNIPDSLLIAKLKLLPYLLTPLSSQNCYSGGHIETEKKYCERLIEGVKVYYSALLEADGILFPKEIHLESGESAGVLSINEAETDAQMPENIFNPDFSGFRSLEITGR